MRCRRLEDGDCFGILDEWVQWFIKNIARDLAAIRHRYENDAGLRVPTRVMSYATPMGPMETDVEELM